MILDVAVYGIINAGKSSLINALAHRDLRPTGPIGGTTTDVAAVPWREIQADPEASSARSSFPAGAGDREFFVHLQDTPGLEEVGDENRGQVATEAARRADLVLFVTAEDLTATARRAIVELRDVGKPLLVVLNKMDLLAPAEQDSVLLAVRSSLEGIIPADDVIPIAAAPIVRERAVGADGTSRLVTIRGEPRVEAIEERLLAALSASAADLKELAAASLRVDAQRASRELDRTARRNRAERVADETSAALALALAVNPIPLVNFLAGPGGLVVLVRRVAQVYDESISTEVARGLASELLRGGRVALWGSLAGVVAGSALKILPGFGHVAGALTQGAAAGYFGHIVGRALVDYLENGHDWGEGGLVATLDRIAASTDRRALTRGLVDRLKDRLRK